MKKRILIITIMIIIRIIRIIRIALFTYGYYLANIEGNGGYKYLKLTYSNWVTETGENRKGNET